MADSVAAGGPDSHNHSDALARRSPPLRRTPPPRPPGVGVPLARPVRGRAAGRPVRRVRRLVADARPADGRGRADDAAAPRRGPLRRGLRRRRRARDAGGGRAAGPAGRRGRIRRGATPADARPASGQRPDGDRDRRRQVPGPVAGRRLRAADRRAGAGPDAVLGRHRPGTRRARLSGGGRDGRRAGRVRDVPGLRRRRPARRPVAGVRLVPGGERRRRLLRRDVAGVLGRVAVRVRCVGLPRRVRPGRPPRPTGTAWPSAGRQRCSSPSAFSPWRRASCAAGQLGGPSSRREPQRSHSCRRRTTGQRPGRRGNAASSRPSATPTTRSPGRTTGSAVHRGPPWIDARCLASPQASSSPAASSACSS